MKLGVWDFRSHDMAGGHMIQSIQQVKNDQNSEWHTMILVWLPSNIMGEMDNFWESVEKESLKQWGTIWQEQVKEWILWNKMIIICND